MIPLVMTHAPNFMLELTSANTEYEIRFNVYSVESWSQNKETGKYNVPDGLTLYVTGAIKWDGCSDLWLGDQSNDGWLHLCGKRYWDLHHRLMRELWEYAEVTIEKFDIQVATM